MRRLSRALLAWLVAGSALAVGLLTVGAAPAHGHAALLASDPAEGGRVDGVTGRVRLVFSEDVHRVAVTLTDARGASFHDGPPQLAGAVVTQPVRTGAADGPATLRWEVTSPDGHRVRGELHLVVGGSSAARPGPAPAVAGGAVVADGGASPRRSAVVAAVLVALGVALFAAWVPGDPTSLRRRLARGWVAAGAVVAALALTGGGHAATAAVPWLARSAVAVHVVAMSAWFGGLLAVLVLLLRRRGGSPDLLRRFGTYAGWAVATGLTAGVVTAVLTVPAPAALWRGTWGLLLAGKVALVGVALGLAALNRRSLRGAGAPGGGLRVRVVAETAVLAVAVGLSGWLSQSDPAAGSREFATAVRMGPRVAAVTSDDLGADRPRVSVALRNADGSPAATVTRLAVQLTAPDGARHRAEPAPAGAGRWTVTLPAAHRGRWAMELGYEVSVVDRSTATVVLPVGEELSAGAAR